MFGESSTKNQNDPFQQKFDKYLEARGQSGTISFLQTRMSTRAKMSIRLKNQAGDHEEKSAKIAKVDKVEDDGDDYDIEVMEEKKDEDELEEEEDDGLEEYFSLQPYEIYDIVMNP